MKKYFYLTVCALMISLGSFVLYAQAATFSINTSPTFTTTVSGSTTQTAVHVVTAGVPAPATGITFNYGTTQTNLNQSVGPTVATSTNNYDITLTAVTLGTSYYYTINNGDTGTQLWGIKEFTVQVPPATVTSSVGLQTAGANGTVDTYVTATVTGGTPPQSGLEIHYGTSASSLTQTQNQSSPATTNPTLTYNFTLQGLTDGTTYYYAIFNGTTQVSIGNFVATVPAGAPATNPQTQAQQGNPSGTEIVYNLIEPIAGVTKINTATNLATFFNFLFKVLIGLASLIAVLMITIAGIKYMTQEAFGAKSDAKEQIRNALTGVVLLGLVYIILYTINPDLLNLNVDLNKIKAEIAGTTLGDQMSMDQIEAKITDHEGYTIAGSSFAAPSVSAGVITIVNKMANDGYTLNKIVVYASSSNPTAKFIATKSGAPDVTTFVPVGIGQNGVAAEGQGVESDKKTPKGTSIITSDRRFSTSLDHAVRSNTGISNLGAAFINTGIKTANGTNRGIGFHGKYNNTLSGTNGCIRMLNDDLLKLAPYMKAGVTVVIE